jgi:hypothetical protein
VVEAMPNFYNILRARKFTTTADTALEIAPTGSATPNFSIDAGGRLRWSSGSATPDTNLYRSAADVLKTDDSFDIASGKTYKIDGADILTATSLGSSVVSSSLTSTGKISGLQASNPSFTDSFTSTGNSTFGPGSLTSSGSSILTGRTDISEIRETISNVSIDGANTLICNYNNGCVFYVASMTGATGNFILKISNVPTENNYAITISAILNQGATGYYPSVLAIDSVNQTIKWVNDTAPSANANKIDIYNFTLIRVSDSWVVLGSASNNYDTI